MDAPTQQKQHSAQLDAQFYSLVKMSDSSRLSNKLQQLCDSGFNVHSIYAGHTTALYVASEYGNEQLVQLLLTSHGAEEDIQKPDRVDGDTAIHAATVGGNIAVLLLLESRLKRTIVIKNNYGHTPLHYALGRGRLDMARHWIERPGVGFLGSPGAEFLESRDWTGATPLHFAARNGEIDGLKLLKEHHATMDVNQRSTAGLTALHYAAWNGKEEAVEWLVGEGSDLEAVDSVEGNTALHWAAMRGHRETVKKLVEAHVKQGVQVFKENKESKTVLEILEKYFPVEEVHALLEVVEMQGLLDMKAFPPMVLVKYAMGHGNSNTIRKLERSLVYAAENCKSEDYKTNLRRLLLEDKLMIWLAKRGNADVVPLLMTMETYLAGGFLPQTAASALNQALLNERFEFADALAKHVIDKGRLPVWIGAMKKHLTSHAGSVADKLDKESSEKLKKEIPLAFWVFHDGREDVAKFLTEHKQWGGLINEQGPKTQRTALHWAYKFDRKDIVASLLEVRGCDPDLKDKEHKTPIRYAVELRREERQVFVDALNAIIVGAALIAAISFNGLVQPPLGYTTDSGKVHVNLSSRWMKAFWISNSSSFFFAMASALMALRGVLPRPDIQLDRVVYNIQSALRWASTLLVGSITFALIAFGSAGMTVVLTPVRITVMPIALGELGCMLTLLWFILGNRSLWFSRKGQEQSGSSQAPEGEREQDVPVDNVREPKYKTGPRYLEYPWEDGLDELDHGRWARGAPTGPGHISEPHVQIVLNN